MFFLEGQVRVFLFRAPVSMLLSFDGLHAVALLKPIHAAQLESIRAGRVKSMDVVPIKAGRAGPGKIKAAYFWPVYHDQNEICFLYY